MKKGRHGESCASSLRIWQAESNLVSLTRAAEESMAAWKLSRSSHDVMQLGSLYYIIYILCIIPGDLEEILSPHVEDHLQFHLHYVLSGMSNSGEPMGTTGMGSSAVCMI